MISRFEDVEQLHLRAIAAKERIAGTKHYHIHNAIEDMYTAMGRSDGATPCLEKALRIREEDQNCAGIDVTVTRMYLAKALEMQGDLTGAKRLRKVKMLCGS